MNDLITHKGAFTKTLIALLALGCLWVLAMAINEFKKGNYIGRDVPAQSTISVTGEGEIFAKPDVATFNFTISEDGKTVAEAQKSATQKTNTAIELVKKGGVAEKDIKTTSYNISPKYEYYYQPQIMTPCSTDYCPPQPVKNPKIVGYTVSQSVEVKVRKIETAGDLLSSIGSVGVQNISGLNFSIDNEEKVKADAREKAIKQAQDKADVLASQLDVSLVRVLNFSEGGNYPIYYAKALGMGGAVESSAPAPDVPAGENQIISNVTITYEIR
ncbi:MAG: SIMPL domain-containing protein [bacterium]|nr:SIMPL domain-containing protein [bacterium]